MKPRITRWIVTLVVAFDGLAVVYMAYLAFVPVKVIDVKTQDCGGGVSAVDCILNPGKTVVQGQTVIYRISYCKYSNRQAAVYRQLIGTPSYGLPASTNNVPPGCRTAISRNTIIPDGVEPGVYHLALSAQYQVNPLQTVTVRHVSEDFIVVAKPTPGASRSSVSGSSDSGGVSVVSGVGSLPARSPLPYGTDPVTQEPTQPTASPAPPTPSPQPGILSSLISGIKGLAGL